MNTKDLRIGNWVEFWFSERLHHYERVYLLNDEEQNKFVLAEINKGSDNNYRPIPITEEILVGNFGFKKSTHTIDDEWGTSVITYYTKDIRSLNVMKIRVQIGGDGVTRFVVENISRYVEYVHELQNFYHLLDGKELEGELVNSDGK